MRGFVPATLVASTIVLATTTFGADEPLIDDYARANVGPTPSELALDPFYKKHTDALGIAVVSSEKVPDAALLVARDIVIHMLAKRPDLREAMVGRKMRVIVMAQSESTTDLPEQRRLEEARPRRPPADGRGARALRRRIGRLTDQEYWDRRARGMGGNPTSCAEENLLGYPGTRYFGENILVHELRTDHGHRHAAGRSRAPRRDPRRLQVRRWRKISGRATTPRPTPAEYWAEGTQTWFWSNYEFKRRRHDGESPDDLKGYDPKLYELLERVYADHHIPMDVYHAKNLKPGRRQAPTARRITGIPGTGRRGHFSGGSKTPHRPS